MQEEGHFHLHINHFGKVLPQSVRMLIEKHSLLSRVYRIRSKDGNLSPLWIVTKKVPTAEIAERLFAEIIKTIGTDPEMNGYAEREVVQNGSVKRFAEVPYPLNTPLPFTQPEFVNAKRGADIHITRNLQTSDDYLDAELATLGFYEVMSAKERIWTLLIESTDDAQLLFQKLAAHFEHTGGIQKIEVEVVKAIIPSPPAFQLMPVARSGFMNTQELHV